MNKRRKLSFGLITVPFLLFLLIILVSPLLIYFYQDNFHFTSYHKDLLLGSIFDRKAMIQRFFDDKKGVLESIAQSPQFKSNIAPLLVDESTSSKTKREAKMVAANKEHAISQLKALMLSKIESGQFSLMSLISKDGKILVSSFPELEGSTVAETELFKNHISKAEKSVFIGFWQDATRGYEFDVVSSVKDDQGVVYAYLHGAVNISRLASILEEGKKRYMVFEIIDRQGNILLSSEAKSSDSMRYNPEIIKVQDQLHYHQGLFVIFTSLRDVNLILLQKAKALQVLYPLIEFITVYVSFVTLLFAFFIYQAVYLKHKVSNPLVKLFSAIRSSNAGLRPVMVQKRYPAEIDNLIKSAQQMIADFASLRETVATGNGESGKAGTTTAEPSDTGPSITAESFKMVEPIREEANDNTTAPIFSFLHDASDKLRPLIHQSIVMVSDYDALEVYQLRQRVLMLSCVVENYAFIGSYEGDVIKTGVTTIRLQEVIDELSTELNRLRELGHPETVFDFDDSLGSTKIKVNKRLIFRIIMNLLYNAFAATREGTITVVTSGSDRDGGSFVNLHISDTGAGYEDGEVEGIRSGSDTTAPALTLAFMLAEIAGVAISVESIKGRGSVYTISIGIDRERDI